MWRQLKKVSILEFIESKRNYENWNLAFNPCVDQAPATPKYKLLQLMQYLSGEALNAIENLDNSGFVYEAAKGGLERKYGEQM